MITIKETAKIDTIIIGMSVVGLVCCFISCVVGMTEGPAEVIDGVVERDEEIGEKGIVEEGEGIVE